MERDFGDLKEARIKAGLSVAELAGALGLPAGTYAAYEADPAGAAALPRELLTRILSILRDRTLAPGGPPLSDLLETTLREAPGARDLARGESLPPDTAQAGAEIISWQAARARQPDLARKARRARLAVAAPDIVAAFCDRIGSPLPPDTVQAETEEVLAEISAEASLASESAAAALFRAKLVGRLHRLWSRLQFDLPQYVSDRPRIAAWQSRLLAAVARRESAVGKAPDVRLVPVFQAEAIDDNGIEIRIEARSGWHEPRQAPIPSTTYAVSLPPGFAATRGLAAPVILARATLPRRWQVPAGGVPVLLSLICAGDTDRITTWLGHLESLSEDEALVRQPEPGGALHTVDRACVAIHPLVGAIDR